MVWMNSILISNRYITFSACICLLSLHLPSTYAQERSFSCYDSIEISKTDITHTPEFNGLAATVFGLRIGMKIKEARIAAAAYCPWHIILEQDKYNNNRFYLYEAPPKGKRTSLAYCKWAHPDSGLKEIIIYESAKECFLNNKQLFSCDAIDSTSTLFRNFFGYYSFSKVELEVPSIQLKTTRYIYPLHSLILEVCESKNKTTYGLVLFNNGVTY
jgi:hypothetical protein